MRLKSILCFSLTFFTFTLFAQISNFDQSNDGWKIEGDAQGATAIPQYRPTGGNPTGHLWAKDNGTGGIWYWTAPKQYLGDKCYAYGQTLSFDLKTNTLDKQFDNKDLIIASPGMILYYDLPNNPGLDWTHYDIKLDESDNWQFNSFPAGPKPTSKQIFQVLSNVTAIKIRGEYSGTVDEGGLDNVFMGGYTLFDLDGDDSSGAKNGNFTSDTLCNRQGTVSVRLCDDDVSLFKMGTVDSIQFFIDAFIFDYEFSATPSSNIAVKQATKNRLTLLNTNGKADTTEFKKVLRTVRATFDAKDFPYTFSFYVWINTLDLGQEHCDISRDCNVIVLKKEPLATLSDTLLCGDAKPILLKNLLKNQKDTFGIWLPKTSIKGFFSPKIDKKGIFSYIRPQIDECPADTLRTKIDVLGLPKNVLGRDSTVCKDSLFDLDMSRYPFDDFVWSDGTKSPFNSLSKEGKYWLTMSKKGCSVSDTIQITNVNCKRCEFYVPNTFSPNDDGVNDFFEIFSSCEKIQSFDLQVFDRWGNLIFQSDNIEKTWNGTYKGIVANTGVYSYFLKTITEYKNKPFETLKKGDLMLMH